MTAHLIEVITHISPNLFCWRTFAMKDAVVPGVIVMLFDLRRRPRFLILYGTVSSIFAGLSIDPHGRREGSWLVSGSNCWIRASPGLPTGMPHRHAVGGILAVHSPRGAGGTGTPRTLNIREHRTGCKELYLDFGLGSLSVARHAGWSESGEFAETLSTRVAGVLRFTSLDYSFCRLYRPSLSGCMGFGTANQGTTQHPLAWHTKR